MTTILILLAVSFAISTITIAAMEYTYSIRKK